MIIKIHIHNHGKLYQCHIFITILMSLLLYIYMHHMYDSEGKEKLIIIN
jgi:hypothetical protein